MRPESLADYYALVPSAIAEPRADSNATIQNTLAQARALLLARSTNRAQPLFLQAWNEATEAVAHALSLEAAYGLALTLPRRVQGECLDRALAFGEKTEELEARLWLAPLRIARGWLSFDLHRYDESLAFFESALRSPFDEREGLNRSSIQWGIARVYRAQGKLKEAMALQHEILARLSGQGVESGTVYLEIAECLQLLRNEEDAKMYYERAHAALSQSEWFIDNKAADLARIKSFYKAR